MIARLLKLFGVLFLVAVVVSIVRSPFDHGLEASRRSQCRNNLKQLALALHNYHDTYNAFPPAYTVDENGNPLHSWRSLILPFLAKQQLYETIDLSKPWNDPVNAEAYKTVIDVYRCPSAAVEATRTSYLAVVTADSVIRPIQSCKLADVTDGTSNTIMLVEAPRERAVHWMAPVDTDEQTLSNMDFTKKKSHVWGWHGAFADGVVQFLRDEMPYDQIRGLVTINGGEPVSDF